MLSQYFISCQHFVMWYQWLNCKKVGECFLPLPSLSFSSYFELENRT